MSCSLAFSPGQRYLIPRAQTDLRSDGELVRAIRAGDEGAFATLYERHKQWVVNLARRFTRGDADALDVLQETFSYLLRKAPDLTLTAKLTTFLYPVVRNLSFEVNRKQARMSPAEVPEGATNDAKPDEIDTLVRTLPEAQREALLLRFVDGFSLQEIADAQRVPLGTVKTRLHHAIKTLREDPAVRRHFGLK